MLITHANAPKVLVSWLEAWISRNKITFDRIECIPLAGDGSTRSFFRIKWGAESRVLLFDAGWISSKDYPPHQLFLKHCNIPVPEFEEVDSAAGFLVMEDLGDELLQHRLQAAPEHKMMWLKRTAELLAHWHGRTFPVPATLPAASRRFDGTKYYEELCFTEEHLSKKFLALPELDRARLEKVRAFCEEIAAIPPETLQHRDFHTRNLLVHGEALVVIDFQDARLGPPHYDLASLLYDAYVPLSSSERDQLLSAYRTTLQAYEPLYERVSWGRFPEDLARIAFQRVVKAAGSFASFYTRYGKKTHLPYLPPALRSAIDLMQESPAAFATLGDAIRLETWIKRVSETT